MKLSVMRKGKAGIWLFVMLAAVFSESYSQQNKKTRSIVIEPRNARVQVGGQVAFEAKIVERGGAETDTVFTWSADATGFGEISQDGVFSASERGNVWIHAAAGTLIGSAHVTIIDTARGEPRRSLWSHLEISPTDSLVLVGETVQFTAQLVDSNGTGHDTTAAWHIRGNQVGTITSNGFFSAETIGVGIVRATLDRFNATTRILVSTAADTSVRDTVRVRIRDCDGVLLGDSSRVHDREVFVIRGLPFPLNVLNGGEIVFPPGCLTENISLEVSVSDAAFVTGDSTVSFADQIVNGISFKVYVNDTLVSPYYFSEPANLILPYKQELMETLGLDEDDLWMFFYTSEGDYDDNGITNVYLDTTVNKIYADIIHFSDIVIASQSCGCTGISEAENTAPSKHQLHPNYPNPFNPSTSINFTLGGSGIQQVSLVVYNMLGQEVRTLLEGSRMPGSYSVIWDGRDNSSRNVPAGIFIYQLRSGGTVENRKMILLK